MKLAVSGYYGFNNCGDEAILQAIKEGFATHDIFFLDADNRYNFKAIRDADVFLSGGGGLLQDKTSVRSFLYYAGLIWYAKLLKKKIYIFAQSIGPVANPLSVPILKKTLEMADLITIRDEASFALIRTLKIKVKKMLETSDPTFILQEEKVKPIDRPNSGPLVAICPRQYKNMPEGFTALMARACDELIQNHKANIAFIPFQNPEDIKICEEIKNKMKCNSKLITDRMEPKKIMGLISQMDFVVGTRLHSLIFAVKSLVPAIGISYDPKVSSFMEEAGLPVLDPNKLKVSREITDLADNMLSNAIGIKNSLEIISRRFYSKAQLNFGMLDLVKEGVNNV